MCRAYFTVGNARMCIVPLSSVLFDGNTTTLTGLDGDTWANQLLTIPSTASSTELVFDFTGTPGYAGVEGVGVAMFNCPEWGISTQHVRLLGATSLTGVKSLLHRVPLGSSSSSCDSLTSMCIVSTTSLPVLTLDFALQTDSDWVHIAEVSFHANHSCSAGNTTAVPATPEPDLAPTSDLEAGSNSTSPALRDMRLLSDVATIVLASVITAVSTVLVITVIFVLVQIAVCKCRPKRAAAEAAEIGTPAGVEGHEYEEGPRGVTVGQGEPEYMALQVLPRAGLGGGREKPDYMQVLPRGGLGGGGVGEEPSLKQNEAYYSRLQMKEKAAYLMSDHHYY